MNKHAIVMHHASKVYHNGMKEVRAIDGVSLEIESSSVCSIVGPSGAGKSTLLHMIGGLDTPTGGKVVFDGTDLYALSDGRRAALRNKRIGFVFQFYHLLPEFSALENVMMPSLMCGHSGIGRGDLKERAARLLKQVGLAGRMDHLPSQLSGGESQRVAIARALANEPDILLCDEPTGNLDSKTSEHIFDLLIGLQSMTGQTLIIVTHDERLASCLGRTIRLKDGKVV